MAEDRELVDAETKIQFKFGDHALEIDPLRGWGGSQPAAGEDQPGVREALEQYAEDIGIPCNSVERGAWWGGRWRARRQRRRRSRRSTTWRPDQVAARVATDFLRRPNAAFHAAGDDTARHLFNRAQTDRWRQQDEDEPSPARRRARSRR